MVKFSVGRRSAVKAFPRVPHSPGSRPKAAAGQPLALAVAAALACGAGPAAATDYSWSSGSFVPGVTAPSPLPLGDTLSIGSGGSKNFNAVAFVNQGTVFWLSDVLGGISGATVSNAGRWEISSDSPSFSWVAGAQPVFSNTGSLVKTAGALNNLGNWRLVNEGGLIQADVGVLNFSGGSAEFKADSRFAGAGTVQVSGNAIFAGVQRSDNLVLAGGVLTGAAAVIGPGVDGPGEVRWLGGDLAGTWTISNNRSLLAQAGAAKRLNAGTLTNAGTLAWQTTEPLQGFSGGKLRNKGLLDLQASATTSWLAGTQPAITHSNSAVVLTRAGVNFNAGNFNWVSDGAQFDAEGGGSLSFNGGSARFNTGSRFTGTGSHVVNASATFVGEITSENLVLAAGTLKGGKDSLTKGNLYGNTRWTGGDLSGRWQLARNQTLSVENGGNKRLQATSFTNKGQLLWASTDTWQAYAGAVLSNEGLVDLSANTSLVWLSGARPSLVNTATGTLRASAGAAVNAGNWSHVSNGGLYEATAGATLDFTGNDNNFFDGTRFQGAGLVRLSGTSRLAGALSAGNLQVSGGTHTGGDGVTPGSRATLGGQLGWTGGDFSGAWTFPVGSVLTASNGSAKRLSGADWVLEGTLNWDSIDSMQGFGGGVLSNQGLIDGRQSHSWVWLSGAQPTLRNTAAGTLRASNGALVQLGNFILDSQGGVFDAKAGSVLQFGGQATLRDNTRYTGAGVVRSVGNARFIGQQKGSNLHLAGGTQTGGDGTPGSAGVVRGTLRWTGGDLAGNWQVDSGQTLRAETGTAKRLNAAQLSNAGTLVWAGNDAWSLFAGAQVVNDGVVQLEGDVAMSWLSGGQPSIINNGLWRKTAGSGTLGMASMQFSNNGILQVDSGSVALASNFNNGGTLSGAGSLNTSALINQGVISPGNMAGTVAATASPFARTASLEASTSTATLSFSGNLVQQGSGAMDIQLVNASSFDKVVVGGTVSLGGTLNVGCLGSCSFSTGQTLTILDAAGALSGSFATVNLVGLPPGAFSVSYDNANGLVQLTANQPIAARGLLPR